MIVRIWNTDHHVRHQSNERGSSWNWGLRFTINFKKNVQRLRFLLKHVVSESYLTLATSQAASENHICTICTDCDQWHKSVGIYTPNHKIGCTPRALVQTRQFFWGNLRTNISTISAQLKAPFHALCLQVPTNSSLALRINICLWIAQCVSNKGLN
jgi:hypothetical protein